MGGGNGACFGWRAKGSETGRALQARSLLVSLWALPPALSEPYLVKELERRPMKAMAAPEAAVVRHPIRSVKMLTMGEQKKTIPMPMDPTKAAGGEKKGKGCHQRGSASVKGQEVRENPRMADGLEKKSTSDLGLGSRRKRCLLGSPPWKLDL